MRRLYVSLILIATVTGNAIGQKPLVDSLKKQLLNHTREDSVRVTLLVQLSNAEMYDHPGEAGSYALQARDISERIKYGEGLAIAYRLLGNSFWAQANHSSALSNFLKGMKVADSINSQQVQADLLANMGMVYNDMNDYRSALNYYKASLTKQVELKNSLREGVMRLNVGNGFYRLKKYDSSLVFYRQSEEILNKLKNTRSVIDLLYLGIGDVYSEQGQYDEALRYYYKSKNSSDTTRHHRSMVHARLSIARVLMAKNQYVAADKELLECLALAKEVHLKTYIRDCLELLYQSANAQKRPTQAFEYFKLFSMYKDSIQNSSETSRIASLQLEYEMQKKKLEIDVVKKDAQLRAEEFEFKNSMLTSSIIGLLLIAIFLGFTFRSLYVQKSLNTQLSDRNVEINRQRSELLQQRDEVIALNEQIRAQQNEVILQRDRLAEKNQNIETLHQQMTKTNLTLEEMVNRRTAALEEQRKRLEEYAYINAFKLRGPVANINGIVELLKKETSADEEEKMIGYLKKSSTELDHVIRSISDTLQHGITAYEKQNTKHGNS